MGIHRENNGIFEWWVLVNDDTGDRSNPLPISTTPEALVTAWEAFHGPDLSMPDQVPMDRFCLFLDQTNRLNQVRNYLNSLPAPNNRLALLEFDRAPYFVPTSPLAQAARAALGLSEADFAEAVRDAAAFSIEDYGAPTPGLLAAIMRFLFVG